MEITKSQYQYIQLCSALTTQQSMGIISADVGTINFITGSIVDALLTDSGSSLLSNDLWNFKTTNPTGSLLNIHIRPKDLSSNALSAIVMLSEGLSVVPVVTGSIPVMTDVAESI